MVETIKEFLARIGRKGGRIATGKEKTRGDSAYYKALSRKAVKARQLKEKD